MLFVGVHWMDFCFSCEVPSIAHGEVYSIKHYTTMALGRDEYPKCSTTLGK
jgi:hypothetical protein